jgi:hypothetical protein
MAKSMTSKSENSAIEIGKIKIHDPKNGKRYPGNQKK